MSKQTQFGVQYVMSNKRGEMATKEKLFTSQAALDRFTARIEAHPHFVRFDRWLLTATPDPTVATPEDQAEAARYTEDDRPPGIDNRNEA